MQTLPIPILGHRALIASIGGVPICMSKQTDGDNDHYNDPCSTTSSPNPFFNSIPRTVAVQKMYAIHLQVADFIGSEQSARKVRACYVSVRVTRALSRLYCVVCARVRMV